MLWMQARNQGYGLQHWRSPGGRKTFFKQIHVAYQIDWNDEHNIMQVKCSPSGQTGDLVVTSKGKKSLNFSYNLKSIANIYTKLRAWFHK